MSIMDWLREQAGLTGPAEWTDADGPVEGTRDGSSGHLEMLAMIEKQFSAEIASGNMSAARQRMLTSVLGELRTSLERTGGGIDDLVRKDSEVRALLARMTEATIDPTRPKDQPGPQPGTRAERLQSLLRGMEARVLAEHQRPHPADGERDALQNLHMRCIEAKNAVHELADDIAATALERELLRPLALDIRRYTLRDHLTVARPIWPAQPIPQSPNRVYFVGNADRSAIVVSACRRLGLDAPVAQHAGGTAQQAWDALRASHVAIFDLSLRGNAVEARTTRALVCYELGMALALGRAIVVIAGLDEKLPFDVDVEPVRLVGGDDDVSLVAEAIDRVLYVHERGGADSSLDESVAQVRTGVGIPDSPLVRQTIAMLDGDVARDPIGVAQLLEHAFGFAGAEAPVILHPTFPGDYPGVGSATLFHVMPFGPAWADEVMHTAQSVCESGGVRYVRGDHVLNPDIMRSIWDELCRATHVLVDLTGLNPNVALELGIAHVLGRNVMVVTQDLAEMAAVPVLSRLRAHTYSAGPGMADGIERPVTRFIA